MKLKDLFKRKHVINLEDSTNLREKDLIRKISRVGHLRLKLTGKSKFKLLDNMMFMPPTTTFELVDYPGHVMRARGLELVGEKKRDDQGFAESTAFFRMPNLWFDGYVAFESSQTAGHYIRLQGNELTLGRYDGSRIFKEECSFKMSRHDGPCGECSFANDWVEDEAGIGVVVSDSEDITHGKDTKRLMVPETPPNARKLPGLTSVEGPNLKKTVVRKDSEEYRRKKFVTFNKRNIIHEHVPVGWIHSNSGFDHSPLNSSREASEREELSYDGSASEDSFGLHYERLDAGRKVKRKLADTSLYEFGSINPHSGLGIKDSVIEEENFEDAELQNEVRCQLDVLDKEAGDDDSEVLSSASGASTKESFSSSGRKCSCLDDYNLFSENSESMNHFDKVYGSGCDWKLKDGWREWKNENLEDDQRYEYADLFDSRERPLSNHEGHDDYESKWRRHEKHFSELECDSLPKVVRDMNTKMRQNLSLNDSNHVRTYSISSESICNEGLGNCERSGADYEIADQPRLGRLSVDYSSSEHRNSANGMMLLCLPDGQNHAKDALLHLPRTDSPDSERDRSDSGLPLSPYVNDMATKRKNSKTNFSNFSDLR